MAKSIVNIDMNAAVSLKRLNCKRDTSNYFSVCCAANVLSLPSSKSNNRKHFSDAISFTIDEENQHFTHCRSER